MHSGKKDPLYRKVNTRARGVHHNFGGDYRNDRRKETPPGMRQGVQRGLDYTPLFRFLLSKVGCDWDAVHSEAVSRLDRQAPLLWLVSETRESAENYVRVGENSYFSGLFVDEGNRLQITAPEITEETLEPSCPCCTHTFNGIPFSRQYKG